MMKPVFGTIPEEIVPGGTPEMVDIVVAMAWLVASRGGRGTANEKLPTSVIFSSGKEARVTPTIKHNVEKHREKFATLVAAMRDAKAED